MITADPGVTATVGQPGPPAAPTPRYIQITSAELIVLLFLACVVGFLGRGMEQ